MMGTSEKSVQLKVFVDKEKKKVIFGEAEEDFVDILFSFMTLPLGTIAKLLSKHADSVGSLTSLYESAVSLSDFLPKVTANYLRVTDFLPIYEEGTCPGHFLKEQAPFIIFKDLLEIIASPSIATFLKFNTLGVPVDDMEVVEMSFGEHEALLLLKASLTSTSALTEIVNASRKKPKVESST
ncbi:hypothetical protein L2E82_21748 [Cichorium intybus]|uniref:Uncharacterized protein n=1 Tax=Cichorium intybus TaxID=13427 RepID=A0ACB9DWK7_CICIN|nr:hypothetical protein L2E82_21748 [Cichorium intybus]